MLKPDKEAHSLKDIVSCQSSTAGKGLCLGKEVSRSWDILM